MSVADASFDSARQNITPTPDPLPPVKESLFQMGGDLGSLDTAKRPSEFRLFHKHS